MDPSRPSSDWQWLHERVRRDGEYAHPVVYSAFRPATEGGDPWSTSSGLAELDQVRDYLMGLDDQPRVLVITDVEEDPTARVFAAIVLARSLAESGQKCVLVDADLRHVGLARHLPETQSEAEGVVDVVQYGASVPASLQSTPVEGVKVLGAGSWRPDGTEVFADADLRRLVSQLRATGHTVLLLTPAWLPDERFHPLLVHGDVVLVALHLDRAHAPFLEELLDYLRGLGVPVGGVVAFAGRASIDLAVDDALHEEESRPRDPAPNDPVPTSPSTPPLVPDPPTSPPPVEVEAPEAPEPEPAPPIEPRPAAPASSATLGGEDVAESSSPVFLWALGALAVVVLAFAGWFYWTQRQSEDEGTRLARAIEEARPAQPVGSNADRAESTATAATDAEGLADLGSDEAEALDDSLANLAASGELARRSATPPEESPTSTQGAPIPVPEDVEPKTPAPSTANEDRGDEALQLALRRPIGGGYALYAWSFPDSTEALTAAVKLERAGLEPGVRGAFVASKDARWYRVLVGRFDTRAQAMQARELLSSRSDVDWVGVMRVE